MWHASASSLGMPLPTAPLRSLALRALEGVGDAGLGEWEDAGEKVHHVRRRLTPDEEAITGPAMDVRDTVEAITRFAVVQQFIPPAMRDWAAREMHRG